MKLREKQKRLNTFVKSNEGLKRQYDREFVAEINKPDEAYYLKTEDNGISNNNLKKSEKDIQGTNNIIYISKEENEELADYYIKAYEKDKRFYDALVEKVKEKPEDEGMQRILGSVTEQAKRYDELIKLKEKGFKDEKIDLGSVKGCQELLDKINCKLRINILGSENGEDLLDKKLIAEASEEFYTTIRKSPSLMKSTTNLGRRLEFTNIGLSYDELGKTKADGIYISTTHLTDYNEYKEVISNAMERNWFMKVNDENKTRYVIKHELGHLLEMEAGEDLALRKIGDVDKIFDDFTEIPIQRTMKKYNLTKEQVIEQYVSNYGKSSKQEMFAELFASSQLGKGNRLTKEFINYLKEVKVWEN